MLFELQRFTYLHVTSIFVMRRARSDSSAASEHDCFPPGHSLTEELCCSDGGLADCFDGEEFSFSRCCPTWTGTDPRQCFPGGGENEEFCCTMPDMEGECWFGVFTQRSCCQSHWRGMKARPQMLQMRESVEVALRHPEPCTNERCKARGLFYASYLVQGNISGPCAEVGVQRGHFSQDFLKAWNDLLPPDHERPSYYMIDMWKHFGKDALYLDSANVADLQQNQIMQEALLSVQPFWSQAMPLRLPHTDAVKLFEDGQLAFVYLDARHDYCAALESMRLWWPKVRVGGVFAGDDYNPKADYMLPGAFAKTAAQFAGASGELSVISLSNSGFASP